MRGAVDHSSSGGAARTKVHLFLRCSRRSSNFAPCVCVGARAPRHAPTASVQCAALLCTKRLQDAWMLAIVPFAYAELLHKPADQLKSDLNPYYLRELLRIKQHQLRQAQIQAQSQAQSQQGAPHRGLAAAGYEASNTDNSSSGSYVQAESQCTATRSLTRAIGLVIRRAATAATLTGRVMRIAQTHIQTRETSMRRNRVQILAPLVRL
jgi:hypothetical protein